MFVSTRLQGQNVTRLQIENVEEKTSLHTEQTKEA